MNKIIKTAAAAFALELLVSGSGAQTLDTATDLARSLALSIDRSQSKGESAAVTFIGASSHGNVVEMNYATANVAVFAQLKMNAEGQRTALTSYFCNGERGDRLMK